MGPTVGQLSLRYRVPLNLSVAILLTGAVVTIVLVWRGYYEVRDELFANASDLGRTVSKAVVGPIRHDDVWQAYEVLRPTRSTVTDDTRLLLLLNADHRVFVSSRPSEFPMNAEPARMGEELSGLVSAIRADAGMDPFLHMAAGYSRIYVIVPVMADEVRLATLVLGYPRDVIWSRLFDIVTRVAIAVGAVMLILLPLAWRVGRKAVAPLARLTRSMSQIGQTPLSELEALPAEGSDEIAQLSRQFNDMIEELKAKEALEQHVLVSDRLAALGRLAAGVAHEINNPLGGMMNALNTYRRFGHPDEMAAKTLSMLERGLTQIKDTVSALLVEARPDNRRFAPQDVDDVYILLESDARKKRLDFVCENGLEQPVDLPSTPVRQILINLALNAVQAADCDSRLVMSVFPNRDVLEITVSNSGENIAGNELGKIFEPFVGTRSNGSGLGLWVTYQIVQQCRGEIFVNSLARNTRFTVRLPLEMER